MVGKAGKPKTHLINLLLDSELNLLRQAEEFRIELLVITCNAALNWAVFGVLKWSNMRNLSVKWALGRWDDL